MSAETNPNDAVEMPAATAWPIVLSLGIVLIAAGLGLSVGFLVAGAVVFVVGLAGWISQLLPGRGHIHEPFVAARPETPTVAPGTVESLYPGAPGYRFRLPEHVHPISSGAWGGLIGGVLMAVPAMAYGLFEQDSLWLPVNLLAGVVVPGVTDATMESLRQFHFWAFAIAVVIHLAFSITFGLMYGVILPMLPPMRGGPVLFGGIIMPIVWSGVCFGLMGVVNRALQEHVNWPWFFVSQFVYGLAMSYVVFRSEKIAVSQTVPLKRRPR